LFTSRRKQLKRYAEQELQRQLQEARTARLQTEYEKEQLQEKVVALTRRMKELYQQVFMQEDQLTRLQADLDRRNPA
jgi:hypothetical protein